MSEPDAPSMPPDLEAGATDTEERLWQRGWPRALAKATVDHFTYAAGIRGVGIFYFNSASELGNNGVEWVSLDRDEGQYPPPHFIDAPVSPLPPCPRGLQVRLEDILWVTDAPFGS